MSSQINITNRLSVQDEGVTVTTNAKNLNFVGAGVTATSVNDNVTLTITDGGVTSVGLSMPSAFTVTNSPIITSGTIGVTGAGTTAQYIRGDGTLDTFPTVLPSSQIIQDVKLGEAIPTGYAVYVFTADGTNIIVKKASNDTEATSSKTLGLLVQGGPLNFQTQVVTNGRLSGLDTSAATIGDAVWLGVGGQLLYGLVNKPVAPAHLVYIGVVTRVNVNNGEIFINVQNGFELSEIHDVSVVGRTNNMVLGYNSATSLNEFKTVSTWLGYTPTGGSGTVNRVTKWTGVTTLGDGTLYDNGSQLSNDGTYVSGTVLSITSGFTNTNGINVFAGGSAIVGSTFADNSTAIAGYATEGIGVLGSSIGPGSGFSGNNTGVKGIATYTDLPATGIQIGGRFEASGGASNYAVLLKDGTEGVGKFLKSVTNSGGANWANITAADVSGIITGTGTPNRHTKWITATTLGDSLIQDDGTTLSINTTPSATIQFLIASNKSRGLSANGLSVGVFGGVNANLSTSGNYYGVYGSSEDVTGNFTTTFTYGTYGKAECGVGAYGYSSGNLAPNIGVQGEAVGISIDAPAPLSIGGKFTATGSLVNYAVQLVDGTEGTSKFLKSVTSDGKANWATLTVADTGLTLTTTGSSGAATLVGNTLNIPQYNLTSIPVAFSPQDVSSADTAPTAASTQYYYQTISTVTGTISKVKLWGFSGSDLVRFGIYRGTLGGSMTLIGQGSLTCGVGPNEISLTAEVGQNLNLVVGENLVVGYYADGTSWRTIYDTGIADAVFGITNTANITTMPATPTGTATGIRFACTLYS